MPHSRHRVLLVEDNPGDACLACEWLSQAPDSKVQVDVVTSLAAALAHLQGEETDAIVLDLNLPDSQGIETLVRIKGSARQAPVIVVSGHSDEGLRQRAAAAGAEDVFGKDETNSRLFSRSVLYVIERNRARVQQARLQALLDANPDAILVANAAGHVRFVNAAAEELFGRTRDELLSEWLGFSTTPGEAIEITIPRAGGARTCELRVAHLDWDGEPVQMASVRDLTARMQAEQLRVRSEDLELQNRRIQEASRLKSEFLANMSHEIRTPMNAIIGLSHLLGRTRLDELQSAYLDKIQIASKALLEVINDVLDLSKIEAGEVALEDLTFDLNKMLRELGMLLGAQAEGKGVHLEVPTPVGVPRRVRGDSTRVRQILINLLGNALKFTERGRVVLGVSAQPRPDGRQELRFAVSDTGIGIEASVLARLFKPFTQADASTTRRFGGTGLGLSIVQQLTQLMGGTVTVASVPGQGSEFVVTLPLAPACDRPGMHDDASQALDVLVVDGGGPDLQRPRRVDPAARALGWNAERIEGSDVAAKLAERLLHEPRPDLLVFEGAEAELDRLLLASAAVCGAGDGPPVLQACRSRRRTGPAPGPGAAVDLVADSRLTPTTLFEAAYRAWTERGHDLERLLQRTQLSAVHLKWLADVHVWVVDDSDVNREVARRVLESEGARVREFGNAADVLAALRDGGAPIDAILMDVQMPGMDGNEATRQIRSELGLTSLPVIALSAGAFLSQRQRSIDVGMVDFVSKPLDPEILIRVVRSHVERVRGTRLPLRRSVRVAEADSPPWPHIEGIDTRDATNRLGHDLSLFALMLGRLLREFGALDAAGERSGLDGPGRSRLAARMHKLRGSAGMLGARSIQRLAGEIETGARGTTAAADLEASLDRLAQRLRQLHEDARPLIEAQAADRSEALARSPATALDPADCTRLIDLLKSQHFAALQCFEQMQAALLTALGPLRYGTLCEAVEGLDFAAALRVLAAAGLGDGNGDGDDDGDGDEAGPRAPAQPPVHGRDGPAAALAGAG